jgi:hypothetical protein
MLPELPMLKIEPALPMLRTLPTLPMLRVLNRLLMLYKLKRPSMSAPYVLTRASTSGVWLRTYVHLLLATSLLNVPPRWRSLPPPINTLNATPIVATWSLVSKDVAL